MEINVEQRAPNSSHLILTTFAPPLVWDAEWFCPGCGKRVVERFAEQPTPQQLADIEADPLCVRCRQRKQLPLFKP